MSKPRLLLVEDHVLVGQGFRALLEGEYQVDGPYGDGAIVANLVRDSKPDILFLDLMLKNRNGMEIIPEVVRDSPSTRIVVVTMNADHRTMEAAIRLGAVGFLPKDTDTEEMLAALRSASPDDIYRSPHIVAPQETGALGPMELAISNLTPRRREILTMIGDGLAAEEVARRCGCSLGSVYRLRSELRRDLGFETDEALTRVAVLWRSGQPIPHDRRRKKRT